MTPITRQRYEEAAAAFARHLGATLRSFTVKELDARLAGYLEMLFLQGEPASAGRYALYGLGYVLDLVTRDPLTLPLAKRALKGFTRKAPEPSRDPPPYEMVWLAAAFFLTLMAGAASWQAAALTLVAADGYLRPSEALMLQVRDFFKSRKGGATHWSVVIAPASRDTPAKNRQYDDGYTVGAHDRAYMKDLVEALLQGRRPDERVFDELDLPLLEAWFRDFSKKEGYKMSPHALRHAGPSHDFYYNHVPVQELQWRGRWLAVESCRRYTKPAKMLRGLAGLSLSQKKRAKAAATEVIPAIMKQLKGRADFRSTGGGALRRGAVRNARTQ